MSYKPSDPYAAEFCTQTPATGAAINADTLPAATANHNGTDDGTFALTVTNLDAGRYKITGTIPAGYAAGDSLAVTVAAVVAGVTGKAVVDKFVLDGKRVYDLALPAVDGIGRVTPVPGSSFILQSNLGFNGDIKLTRKDDQFAADGYGVLINDPGTWPNFTRASAVVTISDDAFNVLLGPIAATIINPAGPNKQILLQFTSAQLSIPASPPLYPYRYDVVATLASGHRDTVASGRFRLNQNVTP